MKQKTILYTVTNIDNVVKTFLSDDELLEYAKKIYTENEEGQPYPSEIHWLPENIQQAKEYINEYCSNLTLSEVTVNESKHTQGPWNVTNSNNSDYLDIDGDCRICSIPVNEVELQEQGVSREEAEANARLIAAAPDMLELLKWISKVTNSPEIGIKCDKMIAKANNSK